jgi:hypothetical protein
MTLFDQEAIEAAVKAEFTHVWRGEDWEKAEPKRRAAYIEPAKRYVAAYLASLEAARAKTDAPDPYDFENHGLRKEP